MSCGTESTLVNRVWTLQGWGKVEEEVWTQAKSFVRELNLILTRTKKCQAITEPQNIWICFVFKSTKEDISRNVFQKTISFPYRERQKRMHFRKCQNKSIQGFIDSTMTTVLYLPTEHHRELLKVPLCLSKTLSGETARYLQVHQNMSGPQKSVGF